MGRARTLDSIWQLFELGSHCPFEKWDDGLLPGYGRIFLTPIEAPCLLAWVCRRLAGANEADFAAGEPLTEQQTVAIRSNSYSGRILTVG